VVAQGHDRHAVARRLLETLKDALASRGITGFNTEGAFG